MDGMGVEQLAQRVPGAKQGPIKRVTVIMVTWNSSRYLPDAIDSLALALSGLSWDVVVADNDSADNSVQIVRRLLPRARVVQVGYNSGYSAGLNAAIAVSPPSDAYLVLNPDVKLSPGSVCQLMAALGDPSVGIAVPRIVDDAGRLSPSLRREPSVMRAMGEALLGGHRAGRFDLLGELIVADDRYLIPSTVDWATGAILLISSHCSQVVGQWNESFLLYSEETDYALRAGDNGLTVSFCPDATATHIGGEAHASPELYSLLVHNRVRLFRMRHGWLHAGLFLAAAVLNELMRCKSGVHRAALRSLMNPSVPPRVSGLGR